MRVEVIYALPQRQERVALDLAPGSTVLDAIRASGMLHAEFGRVGVWGRPVSTETLLREHDRVEIYRPLTADPREIRRTRAVKARK